MDTVDRKFLRDIRPFVLKWITDAQGGSMVQAHSLSGAAHIGTLSDAQAPQFLKTDGSRPLTNHLDVNDLVTIDGVDISKLKSDFDYWVSQSVGMSGLRDSAGNSVSYSPSDKRVQFVVGPGIQFIGGTYQIRGSLLLSNPSGLALVGNYLELANSVAGQGLTISSKVLNVGATNGLEAFADSIGMALPGTLSIDTPNSYTGNHTHAISASSNPGKDAYILRTDVLGKLRLWQSEIYSTDDQTALLVTTPNTYAQPSIKHVLPAYSAVSVGVAYGLYNASGGKPRMAVYGNGAIGWGSGSALPDAFISRLSAGKLLVSGDGPIGALAASVILGGYLIAGSTRDSSYGHAVQAVSESGKHLALIQNSTLQGEINAGSGGNVELRARGDIVLNPDGEQVLPAVPYGVDLGSITQKYRSLHVAEIWAETLVAERTIATIGGRILVAPTSQLVEAIGASDTEVFFKNNSFQSGDIIYLEAGGKIEFMQITGSTGNLLRNASFEDWDGSNFLSWTKFGTITLEQTVDTPANGSALAKVS